MGDNTRLHRTVVAETLLDIEDINRMDWSACSPDLNILEHVWDIMGRHKVAQNPPPTAKQGLIHVIKEE